jgi:cytochrome P450 PksS
MLTMDEPDHTRLRSIVDEAFRRRAILDMEPRIFAIADELAAELFAEGNPADLVERYARKLPLSIICELLGLPSADRPRFIAWSNRITRLTGMVSFLGLIAAIGPMKRYLEGRLQAARDTGGDGGDGVFAAWCGIGNHHAFDQRISLRTHHGSRFARLARGGLEPREPGD